MPLNKLNIYDLSVLSESLRYIKPAMLLLNVYMQKRDALNRINLTKDEISSALGVAKRTVTDWIIKLVKSGAIKYKYSGSTRLNPFFSFDGTDEEFTKAVQEWESFESNIKATSP